MDAPRKWVDNLLSQHEFHDVARRRRGVARRLPHGALVRMALVREVHVALGLGVRDAVALAAQLLDPSSEGVHVRGHLRVTFDRRAFEAAIDARLRDALESAPTIKRGRPVQRSAAPARRRHDGR